jgi:molecular chaperone DnaK (HSP70)
MSVIGIDFGNTECVIAQAKRGGIDIILNENSNRKNPYVQSASLLNYHDSCHFDVGTWCVLPASSVTLVKRL